MAGPDTLAGTGSTASYTSNSGSKSAGIEFRCPEADDNTPVTYTCTAGTADAIGFLVGSDSIAWATEIKVILTDGSGNILASGTSSSFSTTADTWATADLDSPIAVTEGQSVQLWIAHNADYNSWRCTSTTWNVSYAQNGTYASPPDPLARTTGDAAGAPAHRLYGTQGGTTDVNLHGTGRGILRGIGRGIG